MSTEPAAAVPSRKRPLSIWVLTVANGLLAIVLIATSIVAANAGFSKGQVLLPGVIGVGISIAAHLTWFGKRYGRNLLLGLLTLILGLMLIDSVRAIGWALEANYTGTYLTHAVIRGVFCLLWLIINYWVLYVRRARAYFA